MTDLEVAGKSVLFIELVTKRLHLPWLASVIEVSRIDFDTRSTTCWRQKACAIMVTEYMEAVLFALLQMLPPFTQFISRIVAEDYKYKSITIPRGSCVVVLDPLGSPSRSQIVERGRSLQSVTVLWLEQ